MRFLSIIALFILLVTVSYGENVATLKEVMKPVYLEVDNERIYVCDGSSASILVYSQNDYKLETKFGTAGEGPQEFKLLPGGMGFMLFSEDDVLVVNSIGKISIFGKDGKFIKEKPTGLGLALSFFRVFGDKFVGMSMESGEKGKLFTVIAVYDADIKKMKSLTRIASASQGRFVFPSPSRMFYVSGKIIITAGKSDLSFDIFDSSGNKIKTISRDYNKLKVTDEYKMGIHDFFKTEPSTKFIYDVIFKNNIKFAEYFPAIESYDVADNKIYVQTYFKKGDMHEYLIFGLDGKFLKQVFLPVKYLNAVRASPKSINNNKLYQLIENENEGLWELHVTEIK